MDGGVGLMADGGGGEGPIAYGVAIDPANHPIAKKAILMLGTVIVQPPQPVSVG